MNYQKAGTAASSLVTDFLEKKSTTGATSEEEATMKSIAWTVYGGLYLCIDFLKLILLLLTRCVA
jgi:hypothetical protein